MTCPIALSLLSAADSGAATFVTGGAIVGQPSDQDVINAMRNALGKEPA